MVSEFNKIKRRNESSIFNKVLIYDLIKLLKEAIQHGEVSTKTLTNFVDKYEALRKQNHYPQHYEYIIDSWMADSHLIEKNR